jgi:hypothetical protein
VAVELADVIAVGSQLAEQIEPVAVGQAEIEDCQRRPFGGHECPSGLRRIGLQRGIAVRGEVVGKKAACWKVVLYDQDLLR